MRQVRQVSAYDASDSSERVSAIDACCLPPRTEIAAHQTGEQLLGCI